LYAEEDKVRVDRRSERSKIEAISEPWEYFKG
jgi:hypothetical protein